MSTFFQTLFSITNLKFWTLNSQLKFLLKDLYSDLLHPEKSAVIIKLDIKRIL